VLQANGVSKRYGAQAVLDGVSLTVGPGERVGLVGRNGCGKSTLLRVLAGEEAPDGGRVTQSRGRLSVGYLPQIVSVPDGLSVEAFATQGLPPSVPEWRTRKALFGLGFTPAQLSQEAATLSGGEKTRLMLARLLVGEHDLLLLDEPTSHLDIAMLRWLEEYLSTFRGATIIASHDRRFLDASARRIVELDGGRTAEYSGNYSFYAEEKRREMVRRQIEYITQQREINALRQFVARQLGWAEQASDGPKRGRDQRGRIAAKVAKRAKAAEKRLEQMETVEKPREADHVSAALSPSRHSGHVVFEAADVSKRYGDRTLFEGFSAWVNYGDRIGIVGPNGAGKTTLLRLLLREEAPSSGAVRTGAGVITRLVAQEHEELDPRLTVYETVAEAGRMSITDARTLLACFLFREMEVFKLVGDLSGGERSRLAVAVAVVSGANLLVLDEPTNHLDIDTRNRLEDALAAYTGTLIVVSHDRYLLDRLCRRLFVLENGRITDWPDTYSAWEAAHGT
jgi:ATP-binding cassette, subfamily F, member 3